MQSTQPGSQLMDIFQNNGVNLNNVNELDDFDGLLLNISTLSNVSNEDMEISSVLGNIVETTFNSPTMFSSKGHLYMFLHLLLLN